MVNIFHWPICRQISFFKEVSGCKIPANFKQENFSAAKLSSFVFFANFIVEDRRT